MHYEYLKKYSYLRNENHKGKQYTKESDTKTIQNVAEWSDKADRADRKNER